jgi:SAM-dependent methyltransferase
MALMAFRVPGGNGDVSNGVATSSGSLTRKNIPGKCKGRSGDKIYNWLASTLSKAKQGSTPSSSAWGNVLDAGAGYGSMCWLLHQEYDTITEVTATESGIYGASGLRQTTASVPGVDIVVGNWRDLTFMPDTTYDVVVSDYLLGAVEQHWPFGAGAMMDRLLRAVRPGGYLLLVGLEPYEGVLDRSDNIHDRLVLDIEAIGDTAAAIVGEATYRELPEEWVRHEASVPRHGGPLFQVVASEQFSMRLTRASLMKQVEYAKRTAEKIADRELRVAYQRRIKALQHELHAEWPEDFAHRRARNYAFVIKREGK